MVAQASFDGIHVTDLRTGATIRVLDTAGTTKDARLLASAVVADRPVVITDSRGGRDAGARSA